MTEAMASMPERAEIDPADRRRSAACGRPVARRVISPRPGRLGMAARLHARLHVTLARSRRVSAPGVLRALLRRLTPLLFAGMMAAAAPGPARAADWSWFHDDAASRLSYAYDLSTLIFRDQRVRVWVKVYKTSDADETPLDRLYEEVNCGANRVRILNIRPRLEGDDEDSLPIIPFAGDAAIAEHSPNAGLRRAVCGFTRPESARSDGQRGGPAAGGRIQSGRSRVPKVPAPPLPAPPLPMSPSSPTAIPSAQGLGATPVR